ncbi:MAG: hypothetical protein JWP88_2365 [Flaviaesturariibacter sp.]|nr:hypothetical protein [Flaviaesturariibacter sp.]
MKLLFVLLVSFLSVKSFAQIDENQVIKKKIEDLLKEHPDRLSKAEPYILNQGAKVEALGAMPLSVPVKPGVYNLPQDGMPCVVPDTEGIAAMPNAVKVVKVPFRSQMPNAYKPKTEMPDVTK